MFAFDRVVLCLLVVGVWALVFKPSSPVAHSGQTCEISSGTGYGDVDNTSVSIYDISDGAGYGDLDSGSVSIHTISGEVYCY